MWKAIAGHDITNTSQASGDDDWETDPDFVNDVTEQEQRWGSKTIEGSGRTAGAIDMQQLREETEKSDAAKKKQQIETLNLGYGYGGKFGVEADRMDKSAVGHDYIGKVEKHASQKDYSTGFGGKFGVQKDRIDKSAENWDYKEKVEKHASQKDYSTGFGGKFGVQQDRIDKSAVGWDHVEKVEKHESQVDHKKGFGGKFGVQDDRVDKSAVGWDHVEKVEKHESQVDHKKGFGGKFGVQTDRMDKSALGFQEQPEKIGTSYSKVKPDIGGAKPSNLKARFENLAKMSEEETKQKAAEQKRIREEKDKRDREEASKKQVFGEDTTKPTFQRKVIETGREGSIGSAISSFNQPPTPTETVPKVPEPIKINRVQPPPDVIPVHEPVEPPAGFGASEIIEEPKPKEIIVEKVPVSQPEPEVILHEEEIKTVTKPEPEPTEVFQQTTTELENLPSDSDISQLIEDTGVSAIALYDYQAAAEDEISFDPDDIVTHIEMIDEGWWRGLCKNRYGLFPANYVQPC